MNIHKFFDEQILTGSKLPKERQRYTYDDLIAFAKVYAKAVNKNCNLQNVSVSLIHQKATEYAKFIHQDEFDDPCFAPDVEQTMRDFKSGFEAAIRLSNER